ncbi:unnamed protein product [Mucor hiemalis]
MSQQEMPSFLDNRRWHNFKVFVDKEVEISPVQQYITTKKIFEDYDKFTTRVTHGGCHAGTMEAESFGIPIDVIKKGGGWKDGLGRLETHYLGKVPSEFARGMAGFWVKPFGLSRKNRVDPPVELQEKFFPWIEDVFGENASWNKECIDKMNQIDDSEFIEEDSPIEIIEEVVAEGENEQSSSSRRKGKQRETVADQSIDAAKRGFLKLLVRCRRIILQDAAVFLCLGKENDIVNTRLSVSNVFPFCLQNLKTSRNKLELLSTRQQTTAFKSMKALYHTSSILQTRCLVELLVLTKKLTKLPKPNRDYSKRIDKSLKS